MIVVSERNLMSSKLNGRKVYAFGLDAGIGVEEVSTTHLPTEIKNKKLGDNNDDLKFVIARYNTNIAVDTRGRMFMWGENSNNLRIRKPKLFYVLP